MNRHRAYWSNMSDHPNPKKAEIGDRHQKRYERMKTQVELLVETHGFDKVAQAMREIPQVGRL